MTSSRSSAPGSTFAKLSHHKGRTKPKPEPAVTNPARRSNFLVAVVLGVIFALGVILITHGLA